MLVKVTQNDTADFVEVGSYCPPIPEPPVEPIKPPRPPRVPKPPPVNWGDGPPPDGPVCPPMRLVKFTKFDGSCWAVYLPSEPGPVPVGCAGLGEAFPATGC